MTVGELCDLYLAEAAPRIKASTLAMDRSRIDRHVRPLLGRRTVRGLTPEDIEKMQLDIAAGKTARRRGDGRGGVTTGGKGVAARSASRAATESPPESPGPRPITVITQPSSSPVSPRSPVRRTELGLRF